VNHIRWITESLGTAAASEIFDEMGLVVIDARSLIDGAGNSAEKIQALIDKGVSSLLAGRKTVICCDHGMSRSNAIAAGVLSRFQKIPVLSAIRLVQDSTGEMDIKPGPLKAVISALEELTKPQLIKSGAVLLTGSSGGIGSVLSAPEVQRFSLLMPSRSDLDLGVGSTRLQILVKELGADTIIHLANPPISATNLALGRSLTMLKNVIDVCLSENIRLIFPSCSDVYFGYEGFMEVNEGVARNPKGHRGESKHLAEILIDHYRQKYGLRCTVLRLARIFGTQNNSPKFIYNLIERARKGLHLETHVFENAEPGLDLLHVEDAVAAMVRALEYPVDGDFNLGSGTTITSHQIACIIRERYGAQSEIHPIQLKGQTSVIAMNHRKASDLLGWFPRKAFIGWLKETC
jgi:nucleoside-diphosphate-sugar epimerase